MQVRKLKKYLRPRKYTFSAWVRKTGSDWEQVVRCVSCLDRPGMVRFTLNGNVELSQGIGLRAGGSTITIPLDTQEARIANAQLEWGYGA
jgi:hypothetical protein